jgi:peroxiredoxin
MQLLTRSTYPTYVFLVFFLAINVRFSFAQESESVLAKPGHSIHDQAFNEGPRQAAYLMSGMGNVQWTISTQDPMAQRFFNQGISQLHGFWYFEAERSFRQAAAFDPDCPILYWGAARANIENTKRSRGFIKQATDRIGKANEKEKRLIDAWAARVAPIEGEDESTEPSGTEAKKLEKKSPAQKRAEKRSADKRKKVEKERLRDYAKALEEIASDYPEDIEVKAMLVLQLWQNDGKGEKLQSHVAIDALLNDIFRTNPRHPAHHFRIHLWDYRKEKLALDGAANCGPAAPGIAHMWHMPGHTYSRLHRYADAAWQQEASARVDHAHMMRDRVMPDQIHNFAHNNEWLIRDFMLLGRVQEAIDLAKNMIELPRHPEYNKIDGRGSASLGRERLLNVLTTYRLWPELIDLSLSKVLEPTHDELKQDERLSWLAIAYANTTETSKLDAVREELSSRKEDLFGTAKEKREALEKIVATEESKSKKQRLPPKLAIPYESKDLLFGDDDDPTLMKVPSKEISDEESKDWSEERLASASELRELEHRIAKLKQYDFAIDAHIAATVGDFHEALRLSHESRAIVPAVLRMEWLALAGEGVSALTKIDKKIKDSPNELVPLSIGIWIAAKAGFDQEGNKSKCEDWIRKLSPIVAGADSSSRLSLLARIEPIVDQLGLSHQWRQPASPADDVGDRPLLDSLGPFRWSPASAPAWMAQAPDTSWRTSKEFSKKPQLIIFYLGAGCLHCTEQLKAFAPKTQAYRDLGIEVIGISTESLTQLKRGISNADWSVPFPLLANPELDVFKEYRCFDDFEGIPMHGTFLVDGHGKIRWQDIGYEPFMEVDFLLEEANRLLEP